MQTTELFLSALTGPLLATAATIIVASYRGVTLTTRLVFTITALYNSIQYTIVMTPLAVKAWSEAFVAFKRIRRFLLKPELTDTRELDVDSPNSLMEVPPSR